MALIIIIIFCIIGTYLLITLLLSFAVQRFPRNPVDDKPDWGHVSDTKIPAQDGGHLEVWRVEPEGPSRGTIVLAHGWGRNRDRMVRCGGAAWISLALRCDLRLDGRRYPADTE